MHLVGRWTLCSRVTRHLLILPLLRIATLRYQLPDFYSSCTYYFTTKRQLLDDRLVAENSPKIDQAKAVLRVKYYLRWAHKGVQCLYANCPRKKPDKIRLKMMGKRGSCGRCRTMLTFVRQRNSRA